MECETVGAMLRALRHAAGRSQFDQARVLSDLSGRAVTRNEVSRWELGGRLLTPYWQDFYAQSFTIPVRDLQQAVAETRRRRAYRREDAEKGDIVLRREFLGTTLALSGIASGAPAAGQVPPGRQVGRANVAELRRRAARMRRLDDYLGGADTFRVYTSELTETVRIINEHTYTEPVGRSLLSIAAEQAQQAGWAAFDSGEDAVARRLYEASSAAARLAGDPALAGNALSLLAYLQIDNAQSGVQAAAASCDTARGVSNSVRALMLERCAFAHASAGDQHRAEQSLDQAQHVLARGEDQPDPDWVFWADQREFQLITGRCWAELHRPQRAVPILESVLAQYPDAQARDKAVYSTWLAGAYLDLGEVERAAQVLEDALDLSEGVASVRPARRVALLARRLDPHRELPAVANLLERVGAAPTALRSSA